MQLSAEERAILGGERGEGARRALEYQVQVGEFWGAKRFVPVTNVHMMGDIEVMGDGGLAWLKDTAARGARCAVATTTNARCIDFAHCQRLGQDADEAAKERELIATLDGWTREDVDTYAMTSQQRAGHARDSGYFDRSVVPVTDRMGLPILEKDEYIRSDTTLEDLAGLKPSFAALGEMGCDDMMISKYPHLSRIDHVHTPGNSSGIVDGASAVLIGSERAGSDLGLTPRARIVATAVTSTDPTIMLTGPGPAAKKCLSKAGMGVEDIELFEVNEAFASIVLRFMQDLNVPHDIVNVNGGAIAMGHPLGATGAMILGTLLDELERRNLKRGMAALCVGGGMGIATIIERV